MDRLDLLIKYKNYFAEKKIIIPLQPHAYVEDFMHWLCDNYDVTINEREGEGVTTVW